MANYIKLPLAVNPPRSFVAGALNNVANASGGGTVSGTGATSVTAGNISTSGSGTGLTVTVTKGGDATIQSATITAVGIGEGYKAGDTITIAADTTSGTTQWNTPIVYTIVKADLVVSDGSVTNEYQLLDVDNFLVMDGYGSLFNIFQKVKREDAVGSLQQIKLIVDNSPSPDAPKALRALTDAVVKAIQAPGSLPIVDWNGSIELLGIQQQ